MRKHVDKTHVDTKQFIYLATTSYPDGHRMAKNPAEPFSGMC